MFTERFRSHHDAERRLASFLGLKGMRGMPPGQYQAMEAQLQEKPQGKPRGIYIHIPHCDRLCTFCNLNRTERQGADLEAYTVTLIAGIQSFSAYPYIQNQEFEAIYFGGGTPTVLSATQFTGILQALRDHLPLTQDCEITVESTLHNLGLEKAQALAEEGVNRFSLGIQTFSDSGRKLLGRNGKGAQAVEALQGLREAFTGVLGIDIIYSYPGQTLEEVAFDAQTCVNTGVDSVSFYSLMIQPDSTLAKSIDQGSLVFTQDLSQDLERHRLFYTALTEAGFSLLELSKLVKPGRDRYRYIHIQYERGDLLPLGSGAGGNLAGFPMYSMAPGRVMVSPPDYRHDRYYRILGLLQFGVYDVARLCRDLEEPARQAVAEQIADFTRQGFLEFRGDSPVLTAEGVFWGNNMAVEILKAAVEREAK